MTPIHHTPKKQRDSAHGASLYIDGGARGNPGHAAAGWIIKGPSGHVVASGGKFLGHATNNVAEYSALIYGVEDAITRGFTDLIVYSDSELLVRQCTGVYKTKNSDLQKLLQKFITLQKRIDISAIVHIRREQNADADLLVNAVLDSAL